jgi:mannose-6-phosphate isomerase
VTLGPLHLEPVMVPKPWGGRRLERLGRRLPDGAIGESWDVADLDPAATDVAEPWSRVAAGPHAGQRLADLIADHGDELLGGAAPIDGRFPLLVKTLDAEQHLSVQVHPPQCYVDDHPDVALKTESWVVVAAEPDARLMIGLRDGVALDDVADALGTAAVVDLLRRVPARPGDVHHLPAGVVHALGAGVMVAEVQTPSDTTFRLYDWTDEYGRAPRPLHLAAGLRSIELGWEHNHGETTPAAHPRPDGTATVLVDTDHYRIDRHTSGAHDPLVSAGGRARVLLVVDGRVVGDDLAWPLGPGGVVVLPAVWDGELRAATDVTVLEVLAV